jgi:hypothetical protein
MFMNPCSPAVLLPAGKICRCSHVYPKISIANAGVNRVNPVVQVETASISLKYPIGLDTILAIPYLPV